MKCEFCNRHKATAIILRQVVCQGCYKIKKRQIKEREKALGISAR